MNKSDNGLVGHKLIINYNWLRNGTAFVHAYMLAFIAQLRCLKWSVTVPDQPLCCYILNWWQQIYKNSLRKIIIQCQLLTKTATIEYF